MILGALAAISQTNIKRLMAYSSIGHIGYALIGLAAGTEAGVNGILLYITIYIVMNLGTFAVILCMRQKDVMVERIDDLKGLRFRTTGLASEMCAKLGMAVQAMGGRDMFQALQSGALDAGEFIGPWTDSALGFYQVAKNYYWPGVGEPSSAEECAVNAKAYADLPDDLKQAVSYACSSLYNDVWTEYTTKHAQALQKLVAEQGVQVKKLPDDVMVAMGKAAGEVIAELREDSDELVKRIAESFLAYRNSIADYMVYADNGQMNARALDYKYG
jgi:TRAP-type mannitol/chloroaromatic compound transport system substrate-binding protein